MSGTLRGVVVDAGGELAGRLTEVLAEVPEPERFALARAGGVAALAAAPDEEAPDVALVPLSGSGEALAAVLELRSTRRSLPVVVVAANGADEPLAVKAVQLGATDYLVADRLYGTLLVRTVRHAVEVERVRSQLRRVESEWPASLAPAGEAAGRAASLRAALPGRFAELVAEYGDILDRALEQAVLAVDHDLEARMRRLAGRAGELRAGPRDLIELHTAALQSRQTSRGTRHDELLAAEGRMRLLELMGLLVGYYRPFAVRRSGHDRS